MTTEEWAKNEVKIAMEKERKSAEKDKDAISIGYVNGCYDSALKAYHSLCEDGHSGMSWSITRNILIKLMKEIPLTPIEEDEDCWSGKHSLDGVQEQCIRRFSLFRRRQPDGTYKYHDIDLVATDYVYIDHISAFSSRNGEAICNLLFGDLIKFPYMPPTTCYRVRMIEFDNLTDDLGNEIYYVIYAKKPNGERTDLYDFYAFTASGAVKLDHDETYAKLTDKMKEELKVKLAYSESHM